MRCAYLAQDRVDISEVIKCLARAMSKPKAGHMTQLQRVARYLKGVPRKALQYTSQEPSRAHLEVHVDSDWAGDTQCVGAGLESLCGEDYTWSDTTQQYKTRLDSDVQKVSTAHSQREGVEDWVCKACLPTGT